MEEVLKFLRDNPTYYLATVDENGAPQVRPFGTIAEIDGALYIQTGKVKDCYKQMAANPKIAICGYDEKGGRWLRISATAVPDDSVETTTKLLDQNAFLKDKYAPGDGNCVAIRLADATATFSSFSGEDTTVAF